MSTVHCLYCAVKQIKSLIPCVLYTFYLYDHKEKYLNGFATFWLFGEKNLVFTKICFTN